MRQERKYSMTDKLCLGADQFLRALLNNPETSGRVYPGGKQKESPLTPAQSKRSAGLMRINHAGEICAQALYQGQALASRHPQTRAKLEQAAIEEGDHLAWCQKRLAELGSHTSYLNPLWYMGSFMIGLSAGMAGDRYSLGFVAETEKQVVAHLKGHLKALPEEDHKSYKILAQMQLDEERHRQEAEHLGARPLPKMIQRLMRLASRVMVKTAYWI